MRIFLRRTHPPNSSRDSDLESLRVPHRRFNPSLAITSAIKIRRPDTEKMEDLNKKKDKTHKKETHGKSGEINSDSSPDEVKAPNLFERAKEEFEAIEKDGKEHGKTKMHENETHGTSNDIDEDTPVEKVKGPSFFERAKEEIEAIVEAIHPRKDH